MIDQASRYGHEQLRSLSTIGAVLLVLWGFVPDAHAESPAATNPEELSSLEEMAAGEEPRELEPRLTTDQWRQELQKSSLRSLDARVAYHKSFAPHLAPTTRRELLDEAIALDPAFDSPYLTRGLDQVKSLDAQGATGVVDWASRLVQGYPQQSRLAINALLYVNVVLAGVLLWVLVSLVLRYLPFLHHQLAAKLDTHGHSKRRHLMLWFPVVMPLLVGAGVIPTLALALPILWMYSQRRARVVLGLLVAWFALQGVWPAPFGAVLVGLDSQSTTVLASRAANDPPTAAMLSDLERALADRPDDAQLHAAMGTAQARAGQFRSSSKSYLKSLELHPDEPRVMNNLASNHFYLGDIDRAVSGYQQAASLNPSLGTIHHNLSQAYVRKLFFKEGGEATQLALKNGFSAERRREALPRGAVYFDPIPVADNWALAWQERSRVAPYHLLHNYAAWLGTPVDHAGLWLAASLLLSLLLGKVTHRSKLVFECANCAELACDSCHGEHEGAILCLACAANAKRARSDVVLRTLLRNRRHESELKYARRIRSLSGLLFGLGHIYDGVQSRGLVRGFLLVVLVLGILQPNPFVTDAWDPLPGSDWGLIRIACIAGLAILALVSWWGRFPLRQRRLHLHPSNLVSLVDLMEGRARRKANA